MSYRRNARQYDAGLKHGWRSGLEEAECKRLATLGYAYEYESLCISYTPPAKRRKYTPDIVLPNGIVVELKGRFVTADRQKQLAVKAEHPELDIRLVFSNAHARISKQSKTTYAAWAEAKGFKWAHKNIPLAWLKELPNAASIKVITILKESNDGR